MNEQQTTTTAEPTPVVTPKLSFAGDGAQTALIRAAATLAAKRATPAGAEAAPATPEQVADTAIAEATDELNALINQIIGTPEYRDLEAMWGSLERLALDTEAEGVDLALINQPFATVKADLEDVGSDKEQSQIYRVLVREKYLTPGAQPVTGVIFGGSIGLADLPALLDLGGLLEKGNIMGFAQAKPELIVPGGTAFGDMSPNPKVLKDDVDNDDRLTPVRTARQDPKSRRITMGGPMYLARVPYHPERNPAKGAPFFEEAVSAANAPWASVVWPLVHRIAASFSRWDIASQIVGELSGGKHPVPVAVDDFGRQRQVLQIALCDDLIEKAVSDLGFVFPQPYLKQGAFVFFVANAMFNAAPGSLDAGVSYRMINDQIAKDLKRLLRAAVGLKLTIQNTKDVIEKYLRAKYCSAASVGVATFADLARRPLRSVDATVTSPSPGVFAANVVLRPHVNAVQFYVTTALNASSDDQGGINGG